MLDRYIDRPNTSFKSGKFSMLDNMCFAEFSAYYYLDIKKSNRDEENDNQPEILNDELMEGNDNPSPFPPVIPLMSSKEKLKCRKIRHGLRYHTPNRHIQPEEYAHHLLMSYYPFRSESELLDNTYLEKLAQPGVVDIVNENKLKIEPYDDLVNEDI